MSGKRLALFAALILSAAPVLADGPFRFYPITPCRLADTRQTTPINAQTARNFTVQGVCGIPVNAKAVALNATIVNPSTDGYLTLYPSNIARPLAASLVFRAAEPALGNGAIIALAPTTPDLTAYVFLGAGSGHLVLDATGYFCQVAGCVP